MEDVEYQFLLGDLRREVLLQALTYVHGSLQTGRVAMPVKADALDAACVALAAKLRSCPSCGGPKPERAVDPSDPLRGSQFHLGVTPA